MVLKQKQEMHLPPFYYFNEFRSNRKDNIFSAGINIQNIGSKISYTDGTIKDFIPTNLMLGASYTSNLDDYNSFTFSFEANKLLVPTPPADSTVYDPGDVILPGGINSDIGPIDFTMHRADFRKRCRK